MLRIPGDLSIRLRLVQNFLQIKDPPHGYGLVFSGPYSSDTIAQFFHDGAAMQSFVERRHNDVQSEQPLANQWKNRNALPFSTGLRKKRWKFRPNVFRVFCRCIRDKFKKKLRSNSVTESVERAGKKFWKVTMEMPVSKDGKVAWPEIKAIPATGWSRKEFGVLPGFEAVPDGFGIEEAK